MDQSGGISGGSKDVSKGLSTEELTFYLMSLGLGPEDIQQLVNEATEDALPSPNTPSNSVVNEGDSEEMAFLIQCFPHIPRGTLKAKLIECRNDLDATTDMLLNYDALKAETAPQFFDRRQKKLHKGQKRREKRVSATRTQDLDLLAESLNVPMSEAEHLYDMHNQSVSKVLQNHFNPTSWDFCSISTLVEELDKSRRPKAVKPPAGNLQKQKPQPSLNQLEEEFSDEPLTKYRINELKQQYITRMAALSAQAKAHGQRNETRHLAQEYRQEAADIMERLKELQVLEFHVRNYTPSASVVDFHGMTVSVALAICEDRVDYWLSQARPGPLELVTGAGRHSHDGVPRIKNAVRAYLKRRQIKFEELPGGFALG